ncbi:MAG: D-glycero-D-manno-heptose 1,7-bisphosphate phosphatase [Thermoplasmata archaeon]|jgi:D-glycero-D-manno-heptose 1,7-bisphosphate phosphatase|nr:D-glycero-D-manno-heptose 1,7-bisphosphate phosphatase [Thermoplasmata archaeon]
MTFTVFLDRDGVLDVARAPFVGSYAQWEWLPGAKEALARLNRPGIQVCLATNQPFVGLGLLPRRRLARLHAAVLEDARAAGGRLDRIEVAEWPFARRAKPRPGMLEDGGRALGADPKRAVLVGDNVKDARAAHAYGCRAILVATTHPRERLERRLAAFGLVVPIVAGLPQAVDLIESWLPEPA